MLYIVSLDESEVIFANGMIFISLKIDFGYANIRHLQKYPFMGFQSLKIFMHFVNRNTFLVKRPSDC